MAEGTTSIGKALHNLNVFLFEKNKKVMYVVALILIPALTYFVFNWEANDKADDILGKGDINRIIFGLTNGGPANFANTADFVEMRGTISTSSEITERSNEPFRIIANESKVIKKLSIRVTWEDETGRPTRLRTYQNQPDTFSVTLVYPDGNSTHIGENDDGTITGDVPFNETEMMRLYDLGDFSLVVSCVEAGDWEPRLYLGILPAIPDTGNVVDIQIEETYLAPPLDEE